MGIYTVLDVDVLKWRKTASNSIYIKGPGLQPTPRPLQMNNENGSHHSSDGKQLYFFLNSVNSSGVRQYGPAT